MKKTCEYCKKEKPKLKNVDGWFCDEHCHEYWVDERLSSDEYDICHRCTKVLPISMLTMCELCGEHYCEDCMSSPLDDLDASTDSCKGCYSAG